MKLVRIIKNWQDPDLLRQTPGGSGIWDGVQYTLEDVEECDYLLVLNHLPGSTRVTVDPKNIWALIQEPNSKRRFPWVEEGHGDFSKVFTHHVFNKNKKYIATQTCLPWHINKTYDELVQMDVPAKTNQISWVSSTKATLPGHLKRLEFYQSLRCSNQFKIDYFGRGINEVKDKFDALAPYKYSIAIENSQSKHYWTEKIADCFLTYTLPVYYGCTNLCKYFPKKSFVEIDINNYQKSTEIIKTLLAEDDWENRLGAIREARDLVLNKYQLFPYVSDLIKKQPSLFGNKQALHLSTLQS